MTVTTTTTTTANNCYCDGIMINYSKLPSNWGLSRPSSNSACPPAERTHWNDLRTHTAESRINEEAHLK